MKDRIDFAAPLRFLVGISFFVVITVTCTQVISRYVFNNSLIWSEELVRFLIVWMCLVGSAVSNFDDDHMVINILMERLPRTVQFVCYTLRQLLIIVFCVVCSYSSIPLLKAASGSSSGALNLSNSIWRASGTIGLAVMSLMTILRWYYDLKRFRAGEFCLKDADEETAEESTEVASEEIAEIEEEKEDA